MKFLVLLKQLGQLIVLYTPKYAHSVLIIYSLQRHDILCTYFLVAMVGVSLSGGICSPAFEQKFTNFDFLRSGHN